ncbi:hypothetical protein ACQPX6_08960 [Actinomycetospora sp. CA-101289]
MSRGAVQLERADQGAIAAGPAFDHDRYRAALTGVDASEAFTRSFR